MRRYTSVLLFSVFTLLLVPTGLAQNSAPPAPPNHYYNLNFIFKEMDGGGHVVNSRSYATIMAATPNSTCKIRSGASVPIKITSSPSQYQYKEIGVNIDCRSLAEANGRLAMSLTAEVSSISPDEGPLGPITRQYKWDSEVIVPAGVATTVFSADDAGSKGKAQLEMTAILIK